MDVYEIRRIRLRQLLDEEPYAGKQVSLATAIGCQPDYLSRVLNGKKNLGEELARKIESETNKPRWWLDIPVSSEAFSYDAGTLIERLSTLTEESRVSVEQYIDFLADRDRKAA